MGMWRWVLCACILGLMMGCAARQNRPADTQSSEPLHILVMDPLAKPLACECIAGFAQRDYDALAKALGRELCRPVEVSYATDLPGEPARTRALDLIIGKDSQVQHQAAALGIAVTPIMALTDNRGSTTFGGLFIVRSDSPIQSISQLAGKRILFGPREFDEKHAAALDALRRAGVEVPEPDAQHIAPACTHAAVAVARGSADAAAISSYAIRLAEGCEAVSPGELRVIGATRPLPFIRAFATDHLQGSDRMWITNAMRSASEDLQIAMESRDGFVWLEGPWSDDWAQWPSGRSAVRRSAPSLPKKPEILWRAKLSGPGFSGVCVSDHYVVVADKSPDGRLDLWRCLDSETGREIWQFTEPAAGNMDFTNAPRAMPVVQDGRAYLLNAFGSLHCLDLYSGVPVWECDLLQRYGGKLPTWGLSSTPLLDERGLICQTTSAESALVCLDPATGTQRWALAGMPTAYASPIRHGKQVLGMDESGVFVEEAGALQRLTWPEKKPEWMAATPLPVGPGRVLVSDFASVALVDTAGGSPRVLAVNQTVGAGTSSPVASGQLVFVAGPRRLTCLRVTDRIEVLWQKQDDRFGDHASLMMMLISDPKIGRMGVLVTTVTGHVLLVAADQDGYHELGAMQLRDGNDAETEIWSHPAMVAGRLYVRTATEVVCLKLQ